MCNHIFPFSLNKSGITNSKLNSIVNKVTVSKSTNREIGNTNPDKYLVDLAKVFLEQGSTGDLDRRFGNCIIPYSSTDKDFKEKLSKERFDNFLKDRAGLLISRIREVVGESWQAPAEGEANLEDDKFITT